jgi:hypothetical protein
MSLLPPHTTPHSTRLTHAEAHTSLLTFLRTAHNHPAYRPDSSLSERGPTSSSGAEGHQKLNLLHKLLAGIEGKRIGGRDILDLLKNPDEEEGGGKRKRGDDEMSSKKRKRNADGNENGSGEGESGAQTPASQGWQDKDAFEKTQTTEDVDVMNEERNPTANVEQPVTQEDEVEMMEVVVEGERVDSSKINAEGEVEETTSPSKISKEERNRRKKEKKAEERRKKEAAKRDKNK